MAKWAVKLRRAQDRFDSLVAVGDNRQIELVVTSVASRALAAIPAREQEALLDELETFAAAPFAANSAARPLRGRPDVMRLRHGDWRALCRIDRATSTIVLERVGHRREIYR
jgi:mRNA interferase RelE/StbE